MATTGLPNCGATTRVCSATTTVSRTPGISSLFDFTAGAINLLGDQFKPGFLNTDRRNVANVSLAYVIPKDSSSFLAALNKMTLGTNIRAASGNPLSAFASHPIYLNTVRYRSADAARRAPCPTRSSFDGHMDYPWQFHEKYTLKLAFDAFNIFNTQHQTNKNQNLDSSPGVAEPGLRQAFRLPGSVLRSRIDPARVLKLNLLINWEEGKHPLLSLFLLE